jgi:hypothetical protein
MIRDVRLVKVPPSGLLEPQLTDGLNEDWMLRHLAGYILEQPSTSPPPAKVSAWDFVVVLTDPLGEPKLDAGTSMQASFSGALAQPLQLRPVGRLVPVAAPQPKPEAPPAIRTLRPVQSGQTYRIPSRLARGLVTPDLAEALETVFERFAKEHGFTPEKLLEIRFARGFKAGSYGHGEGRAADIASVGGKSLLEWKQEWEQATPAVEKLSDPQQRADAIAAEQKSNLGYGLYKSLQEHGGWLVDPKGWRPYRGVMQLFGPWTATEGPWKMMRIKSPNEYQRLRLADQQWVFQAHRDHIHVAR